MNRNVLLTIIIIAVIVVLAILFFESEDAGLPGDNNGTPATTPGSGAATTPLGGTSASTNPDGSSAETIKMFSVTGKNYEFTPNEITVNRGDTVRITFVNQEGTHNFNINDLNVATTMLRAGQSGTITFVADKIGTFEYHCSVNNHKAMGMKGNLIVR